MDTTQLAMTTRENLRRLGYLILIAVPLQILHLGTFWLLHPGSPAEAQWRHGLLLSYGCLLAIFSLLGLATWRMKDAAAPLWAQRLLVTLAVGTVLAFGIVITLVDQRVTPSISPLLIACTLAGMIFLISPARSVVLFAITALAFCLQLPESQAEPRWLLSDQLNALTASGMGVLLSVMQWRHHLSLVRQQARLHTQRQELEEKNRQLEHLAGHDPLTGLYNRREFDRLIQRELGRVSREPAPICLMLVDIDHFKSVNDRFGHPVGDEVIRHTAQLLVAHTRSADCVARLGGEEFLVLLPATTHEAGCATARKLRALIAETPIRLGDAALTITASFGVVCLDSGQTASYEMLYEAADQALYQAKQNGRDRIESVRLTASSALTT
jgi:diguanylate cyclase (GGDEF)-like protein